MILGDFGDGAKNHDIKILTKSWEYIIIFYTLHVATLLLEFLQVAPIALAKFVWSLTRYFKIIIYSQLLFKNFDTIQLHKMIFCSGPKIISTQVNFLKLLQTS